LDAVIPSLPPPTETVTELFLGRGLLLRRGEGREGTALVAGEEGELPSWLVAFLIPSLCLLESKISAEGKVIEIAERLWNVKPNV
jgi:hypothetical protein